VPEAYAATVVTRLDINRLRSAEVQRETYVGEWLPAPVVTGGVDERARADSVTGVALERQQIFSNMCLSIGCRLG